jgi:hypothetical protein
MAKTLPKINHFPLPVHIKVPLEQAIHAVGQKSGLNPTQAGQAALLMQSGIAPGPTKIIVGAPRVRQ